MVVVTSELLGQFVNTLTPDYKYSSENRASSWTQVPRQIFGKLKTFSGFFIAFLKSTLNLQYFEKKDKSLSLSITEHINCETGSYLNVQKPIFHATLRQIAC